MKIKKKILILGGYGFLGSNLYRSLKDIHYVFRYGNFSKKKEISLSGLKKIKKNFDIIIHSAGGSSVTQSILDPKEDKKKKVGSTRTLMKFIKKKKIKPKLIFISSAAVFGNSIKKKIKRPISPYGKHKLKSEKLLINFAKKNKLELNIIRFFSLYGEGLKKQLLWDVLSKLKKNFFIFNGSGEELRSWMHVNDAVKIVNLILFNSLKKISIINAPGHNAFTNKDVINKIYKYLHVKEKPIFNNIPRKGDPKILVCDNKDLKMLDWKQSVDFSLGLKKYIAWFKKK